MSKTGDGHGPEKVWNIPGLALLVKTLRALRSRGVRGTFRMASAYLDHRKTMKRIAGIPIETGLQVILAGPSAERPQAPRIAVQAHIFYPDLAGEIIENLNHIPYRFDLFVSTPDQSQTAALSTLFTQNCKAEKVHVQSFPNRGRDIAPMLAQLAPVIGHYETICHIHTKKSTTNGFGEPWRRFLFRHLLGGAEYIRAVFAEFERDNHLGLIFPPAYPALKFLMGWNGNKGGVKRLLKRIGVVVDLSDCPAFPAGNMLWARTAAVEKLFSAGLAMGDFPPEKGQVGNTPAHAVERAWSVVARAAGYGYRQLYNNIPPQNENNAQTGKNLLLFAHYDAQNIISSDDLAYLKSLTEIADELIFLSNSPLSAAELAKTDGIVARTMLFDNEGFDFGAWKKALECLEKEKTLTQYDHLILVNNSCTGPTRSLKNVFSQMRAKGSDFWGLTLHPERAAAQTQDKKPIHRHLQSYFLVFAKKAFTHEAFTGFWETVSLHSQLEDVIQNCENVLTKTLADAGLHYSAYIEESAELCVWLKNYALLYEMPYEMLIAGSPLLKKKYVHYAGAEEQAAVRRFID